MDLKEEALLGAQVKTHWYYQSKLRAVRRLLQGSSIRRLLDVGAGSGFFSREVLLSSNAESSICVDPGYATEREELLPNGGRLFFRRTVEHADVDLVLMMDVLEHVANDDALLREYISKVPIGTRFLISVPAFHFLWSEHDEFLGHFRRYTLSSIEQVVRESGLTIQRGAYFFLFVLPVVAGIRMLGNLLPRRKAPRSQLSTTPALLNRMLLWSCATELPLLSVNRLAGVTAFVVALKG